MPVVSNRVTLSIALFAGLAVLAIIADGAGDVVGARRAWVVASMVIGRPRGGRAGHTVMGIGRPDDARAQREGAYEREGETQYETIPGHNELLRSEGACTTSDGRHANPSRELEPEIVARREIWGGATAQAYTPSVRAS